LELQAIAKTLETLAVFPVNSDIADSQYTFTPFPLINVVMDLVMIFKVTSNNIKRERGVHKCIKVFHLFSRVRFQLVIQFFLENVSTILQLLVAGLGVVPQVGCPRYCNLASRPTITRL